MEGWIKLHRKLLENPIIMKDSHYLSVWIYLLLNATHKEYDVLFKGKRITLKPGQLITGRKLIAEKLNIDENKVQRILKTLENEHQIEQQKSNKNRVITMVSWDKYQQDEQQNKQQVNNNCTTSEQQVNTNKNVKNDKNINNNNNNNNKSSNNNNNASDSCVDGLQKKIVNDSCVDGLQEVIDFYNANIGLITPYGLDILSDYEKELGKEVVIFAMEKAVEANVRTIAYIKGTLNNWVNAGVKTLIEAKEESNKFKAPKREIKQETAKEEAERLRKEWGLSDED